VRHRSIFLSLHEQFVEPRRRVELAAEAMARQQRRALRPSLSCSSTHTAQEWHFAGLVRSAVQEPLIAAGIEITPARYLPSILSRVQSIESGSAPLLQGLGLLMNNY